MRIRKILVSEQEQARKIFDSIQPNVILNRFDMRQPIANCCVYVLNEVYVPFYKSNNVGHLGIYLRELCPSVLARIVEQIFKDEKFIPMIRYLHTTTPMPGGNKGIHWHVDLNTQISDFDAKLSKKTRYNTKWYPKKILKELGDYKIDSSENISNSDVQLLFRFKKETNDVYMADSPKSYRLANCINYKYVLSLKGRAVAIALLSKMGNNVFLDNIGYDSYYSNFSIGSVLYYSMVKDLIESEAETLFLLGGRQEYKRRFNGVLTETYSGEIPNPNQTYRFVGGAFCKLVRAANRPFC